MIYILVIPISTYRLKSRYHQVSMSDTRHHARSSDLFDIESSRWVAMHQQSTSTTSSRIPLSLGFSKTDTFGSEMDKGRRQQRHSDEVFPLALRELCKRNLTISFSLDSLHCIRKSPTHVKAPSSPEDSSLNLAVRRPVITMERERRRLPVTRYSIRRPGVNTDTETSENDVSYKPRSREIRRRFRLRRICTFPDPDDLSDKSCRICLSTFNARDRPTRLPCGHVLGFPFLTTWTVGKPVPTCPICRTSYLDRASVVAAIRRRSEMEQERDKIDSELVVLYRQRKLYREQKRPAAERRDFRKKMADLKERRRLQLEAKDYLPSSRDGRHRGSRTS